MSVPSRPIVCVVVCHVRTPEELDAAARSLVSLLISIPGGTQVVVVDDGSPDPAVSAQLDAAAGELGFGFDRRESQAGLAGAANPLVTLAAEAEADLVLLSGDVELPHAGWLDAMLARTDTAGRPAGIVGGRLVFPNGMIEHAGLQLSLLRRRFVHRHLFGPQDLRDALKPCRCPVAPGLVLVRNEVLCVLGELDAALPGQELIDYCLRAFDAGFECIYEPAAAGTRLRPLRVPELTADESAESWGVSLALLERHADIARWVAEVKG